jgi:tetratricopeptide (TPR) repeat protein
MLEKGLLVEALEEATRLLEKVPENRDVWYIIAVAQRYLKRIPEALATLARFERIHPEYSRLFQERGHCYVALKEALPAIEAFMRAVSINPALPASWNALKILYGITGQRAEAEIAAAHVATLAKLPPEIVTATTMFADGEIYPAERIVRDFLLKNGDHVEAMRLLARIGMKLEVYDDAELLLESALILAPDYQAMRYDYVLTLLQRHKHSEALHQLERLLRADPANRAYRITQATALNGVGKNEEAIERYRTLLAETPDAADIHLSIAHSLKTLGRQQEAVASYRAAYRSRPGFGDAYWSLANLKTYRFTDEELAAMREQEGAREIRTEDRYHLCFALGKALEDRGRFEESFGYYERGNALKKSEIRFKNSSRRAGDMAALRPIRFSSSDFHAPAPRSSNRFSPPIPRSKAPWNYPTSCATSASCRVVSPTPPIRDIPPFSPRFPALTWRPTASAISRTHAFTAAASRASSTRCRTISAISGSFT